MQVQCISIKLPVYKWNQLHMAYCFNSLTPGRCGCYFCEITIRLMLQNLDDDQ